VLWAGAQSQLHRRPRAARTSFAAQGAHIQHGAPVREAAFNALHGGR
jgi:hypothetical protein